MARLRPHPVAALCAITLFIWGNRIWLAWTNEADTLADKLRYSVPITAFVVAALVLGVAMLAGVDRSARWFTAAVQAFSAGTIVYWSIRLPLILLADHGLPFKVVHAVLAIASVVSAALAWRAVSGRAVSGRAVSGRAVSGTSRSEDDPGGRYRSTSASQGR